MSKQQSMDLIDVVNFVDANLNAAAAIMDCIKVLAALERTPVQPTRRGQLLTGEGHANGYTVRDSSMSNLMCHGVDLVKEVQTQVHAFFDQANGESLQSKQPVGVTNIASGKE